MGRTRSRKDEKEELGARAGIVPANKLVLEEVVREGTAAPTPREREKVRYCIHRAMSEYSRFQLRVEGKERASRNNLDHFELYRVSQATDTCLSSRKLILFLIFEISYTCLDIKRYNLIYDKK